MIANLKALPINHFGAICLGLCLGMLSGCGRSGANLDIAAERKAKGETAAEQAGQIPKDRLDAAIRDANGQILASLFRDVTGESGIDATYRNGQEAGHYAILESLGGGLAVLDFDGDGLLDVFITGGGYFDGPDKKQLAGHSSRLFKNLGSYHFREVTTEAGLDRPLFYTHGAAVCDYDRDGWPDLLVTGWARLALFRNEADGKGGRRFREAGEQAGLAQGLWTTSAAWADYDGDGWPDLYVCQYVDWSPENNPECKGYNSAIPRDVCPPKQFNALSHKLYRNLGNGAFADVSKAAGLRGPREMADYEKLGYLSNEARARLQEVDRAREHGKGLGVVALDLNGDGKPDIYVANDTVDNFLYLNKSTPGQIRFEEVGYSGGVACDGGGTPNGSMGTDAADYDRSGKPSLWCTNYENEIHALYRNLGGGLFNYTSQAAGIAAVGTQYVGFGTGFLDLDNDGWEDLFVANGHVIRHPTGAPLAQKPILFRNRGGGRFQAITPLGGPYFQAGHVGRGVVLADLTNRGQIDLIVSHVNEPVAVLKNEANVGNHWLGIDLAGKDRRDCVGARVTAELGNQKLARFAKSGSSYLSSSDRRLIFGLGQSSRIDRLTVEWPSGQKQEWAGAALPVDRYWLLTEGKELPAVIVGPGRVNSQ